MPIGTSRNQTFNVILDSDKDLDPQPTFIYRFLTMRQWKRLMKMDDQLGSAKPDEQMDLMMEACGMGLVGWKNMTDPDTGQSIPFDKDRLQDLLSIEDAQELAQKIMTQIPSYSEKKTSDLLLHSDTVQSVPDVQDPIPVKTDQTQEVR